ncbi:Clathrin adaptor, mu subunit, C-terminal, partial [Cynara cardunculus var. scolymus]
MVRIVVLAASFTSKSGKVICNPSTALISTQFVDMSRVRIEGLLAAFPKLIGSGKQHTYVETENVRYVYQPMESIYLLLVTNKQSNILEDLDTLRILSKVLEFSASLDEEAICKNAFELIFAFDEVISLGHEENVRQYCEMVLPLETSSVVGITSEVDSSSSKPKGEMIVDDVRPSANISKAAAPPTNPVTLTVEEKLNVTLKRDGGLSNFDAFPAGQSGDGLGLLKWRMQSKDESAVPLTINCWPSVSGNETYVSIEYEASSVFDLQNVVISVPLPALREAPSVRQIDGEWSGSMEFVVPPADTSVFFPISVRFLTTSTFSNMK